MTDNVADHPTSQLKQAIARCVMKPEMKGFLACIQIAHDFKLPLQDVRRTWEDLRSELVAQQRSLEHFWEWLGTASLRPRYHWPAAPSSSYEFESDTCLGNYDPFGYVGAETTDRIICFPLHNKDDPYGGFVPAMEFADLLPTWFRGRDPGQVISEHIRSFYPQIEEVSEYAEQPKEAGNETLDVVRAVAQALALRASASDPATERLLRIAANCLQKHLPANNGTTVESAIRDAKASLQAPEPVRLALIELGVLESVSEDIAIPMFDLISRVIAQNAEIETLMDADGNEVPAHGITARMPELPWSVVPRIIWCLCNAISRITHEKDADESCAIHRSIRRCLLAWRRVADIQNFGQSPVSRVDFARMLWCMH